MTDAAPAPVDGTVDDRLLAALRGIVGAAHVRHADGELTPFAHDATPLFHHRPDVVVFPASTEEVAAVLRLATEWRVPVVPRGAGSNLCAATVPLRGGIVLVLTRMDRILEVNAEELLVVAQPGVTNSVLAAAVAARGLLFAPDPGSRTVATIGGNVATCAGGLRGLKYGVTRNYVLGLEVVLATGEVIRTGGRLWKDVAGYDLTRLLTGSEGTLGVITEVTMALLPLPPSSGAGVAYFPSLADAGRAVTGIVTGGLVPATLEFLDQKCIGAVEDHARLGLRRDAGALLLFGDDGPDDVVRRNLTRMAEQCTDSGALDVVVAGEVTQAEALFEARRCSLPALSRLAPVTVLEDVCVPRPRIAQMVDQIDRIADRHEVLVCTFGHAGDGNLHPTACIDLADGEAEARVGRFFDEVFRSALALGGTITGEHGVGAAKLPYLQARLGSDQMALLRRLKAAFDPAGVLNPGKLGS
ncbi:MAG TPA: FAD-linked oxidase C-terminal domain-containing protein [Mycobacteriales bacterium]